jgi:hypothetical protein
LREQTVSHALTKWRDTIASEIKEIRRKEKFALVAAVF